MLYFKKSFLLIIFLITALFARSGAEKIPLDHSVYDDWKILRGQQFSADGNWISYEVNPQRGDGKLFVVDLQNLITDTVDRGHNAVFSAGSNFVAYAIKPRSAEVRQARAEGKKEEEMPRESLEIRVLPGSESLIIEDIQSFTVPEKDSDWIFYHEANLPDDTLEGSRLYAYNPITGEQHPFDRVTDYTVSDNGRLLAFLQASNNNNHRQSVHVFQTDNRTTRNIFEDVGHFNGLSSDKAGNRLAFIFTPKKEKEGDGNDNEPEKDAMEEKSRINRLYVWENGEDAARLAADTSTAGMLNGWHVSADASPGFSDSGNFLFFGTAPLPIPEKPDTLLPNEKHSLDVWHYRDPLIQPMQLVQLEQEKKRSYKAVLHMDSHQMVQLADKDVPDVIINKKSDHRLALGVSKLPYLIQNSFESGDYQDVFLIDLDTGERTFVLEKHRGSVHLSNRGDARLSPGGNYLLYYSQEERGWHSMPINEMHAVNITSDIPVALYDELHDAPSEPDPYGILGWVDGDSHVLIYDRFDIWKVDPKGIEDAVLLTNGYGRSNNIRFRHADLNTDNESIGRREQLMLSAFNKRNKQSGFYNIRVHRPGDPSQMVMDDTSFSRPAKAEDADVIAWRKSTFDTYPDLWVSDTDFSKRQKISDANPQQSKYLWGSVELVDWVSFANDSLQGLLYLPEIMEAGKEYPMIVYFYERLSDRKHSHYIPAPSRSTVNISYAVSNGYIVFVPDIQYTVGYPGQSAYDAIVSGTKAMVNQYDFIDRQNIGIQGQSWAGYQIAWLITQTDMFKAAMAGAPVSNMISAYGGIRWSTGMSRIYQYEETQSRIGGTIWDQTLRYIKNSPVFFANKVNTPLLMMHNDADGAVPWYQGIEYFMALRRLDKPVWMLNYNDEAHNLTRWPNRVDLSQRMFEFFDHYLKDAPAPRWMTEGVPAVNKNN